MINVMARASCPRRALVLRSVLRRSWPKFDSHELVLSMAQRIPSGTGRTALVWPEGGGPRVSRRFVVGFCCHGPGEVLWHRGVIRRSSGSVWSIWSRGGPVAQVAAELGISDQSIYTWRRQARINAGVEAGLTTAEKAELAALRKRVRELETELAIHRRATELLKADGDSKKGSRPSE